MMRSYSDNAVMTKVRALYGKRLTEADYDQLLHKKTVGEIADYLQKETCYAENLEEVRAELIHRGQLENLIRRRPLALFQKLSRYAYQETLFLKLYILRSEIDQLLAALRMLNAGRMDRYIITLPAHLAKLFSFDLFALPRAKNFDGVLDILQHSIYYSIVGKFRPTAGGLVDITLCEAAMLTHYYRTALDMVGRRYSGDARKDLERLLLYGLSVHNVSTIYRMRRYLGAKRDMIEPRVVRVKEGDNRLFDQLLDAPDTEATQRIIEGLRPLRRRHIVIPEDTMLMSETLVQMRRAIHQRVFRFSVRPVVVVIAYMALLEIEIDNIVHIIEGIRYGLPPDELKKLIAL